MKNAEFRHNDFVVSTDPSLIQIHIVHQYLSNESYWAKDRPLYVVSNSIKNSLCFGVYKNNEQMGFARIETDYSVFAYIMDLFILTKYQRQGLGKWLMSCIMSHPDLQGKMRWALCTRDAHGLYRKYRFSELSDPGSWMELDKRKT